MKRVLLFTFMAAFMCAAQVSAKELRKIVFKVDQMECVNCENKVKKNIPFEKGVKKMETDLKTRTVTITYDWKQILRHVQLLLLTIQIKQIYRN